MGALRAVATIMKCCSKWFRGPRTQLFSDGFPVGCQTMCSSAPSAAGESVLHLLPSEEQLEVDLIKLSKASKSRANSLFSSEQPVFSSCIKKNPFIHIRILRLGETFTFVEFRLVALRIRCFPIRCTPFAVLIHNWEIGPCEHPS